MESACKCPFCGNSIISDRIESTRIMLGCELCDVWTFGVSRAECVSKWNRRGDLDVAISRILDEVEVLRESIAWVVRSQDDIGG